MLVGCGSLGQHSPPYPLVESGTDRIHHRLSSSTAFLPLLFPFMTRLPVLYDSMYTLSDHGMGAIVSVDIS